MANRGKYCYSPFYYKRIKSKVVEIGNVPLGGEHPIRIQSMASVSTLDTGACVKQAIKMIDNGCEIVRFTAPNVKEAENLKNIKSELLDRGFQTPLVADIHYTPNAAEVAAGFVEKVRINPGNFAEKNMPDNEGEIKEKILKAIRPLIQSCIENRTVIRIGVNHGSLSDRMMQKYGDTALGMVESAIEYIGICEELNFEDIVISLKSSNVSTMVYANRLMMSRMMERGKIYPLHLGVTEAGEGEDGRVKSAIGIGALLEDGIGDTIRVSLTEAPEKEMPVAKKILTNVAERKTLEITSQLSFSALEYQKRPTNEVQNIGGHNQFVVIADLSKAEQIEDTIDKLSNGQQTPDYVYLGSQAVEQSKLNDFEVIVDAKIWQENSSSHPLFTAEAFQVLDKIPETLHFIEVGADNLAFIQGFKNVYINNKNAVLVLKSVGENGIHSIRRFICELESQNIEVPVVINYQIKSTDQDEVILESAKNNGTHLIDGHGDGIMITSTVNSKIINSVAFGILQACGRRVTKTEYISCPSCGRTQFDLEETTAKIRSKTQHLKGLKIGIMGCIVNGPGEMADAHYGYVGSGKDQINLYYRKEIVMRNVPSTEATDELIKLIKSKGDWVEP